MILVQRLWAQVVRLYKRYKTDLEIKRLETAAKECLDSGLTFTASWYKTQAEALRQVNAAKLH